jgi:energy-converting hydrogenase B subunit Q
MVHFPAVADYALIANVTNQPGILYGIAKVLADRQANIAYIDIIHPRDRDPQIYLEFAVDGQTEPICAELEKVSGVSNVQLTPSFSKIYGKRIIIMGGGAQVGQVALGAIAEADRHNIRGERISVDTIPLVGEEVLASAVRAVVRLPRVRLLVLAGSIMGGDISKAVEEVRAKGLLVISLNMAGSVPDFADLVVSDPVQAGVMAVMAIADTAKFDIVRQQRRRY